MVSAIMWPSNATAHQLSTSGMPMCWVRIPTDQPADCVASMHVQYLLCVTSHSTTKQNKTKQLMCHWLHVHNRTQRSEKFKYGKIEKCVDVDSLVEIRPLLEKYNYTFTSNGYFFRRDEEGILPRIFSKFFAERKHYKKEMKSLKDEGDDRGAKIADLYQYTLKILLNSGYGFLSNIYSRYFDIRIAEAITSNGQVCVRGATKAIIEK